MAEEKIIFEVSIVFFLNTTLNSLKKIGFKIFFGFLKGGYDKCLFASSDTNMKTLIFLFLDYCWK